MTTKHPSALAVRIAKICLCIGLCCMTLFLSVGYALLTDTLKVSGNVSYEPKAIYIISVSVSSSGSTNKPPPTVTKVGSLAIQHGDYTLEKSQGSSISGCYIDITITVKNNSGVPQYLVSQKTEPENKNLVSTFSGIKIGDPIPQGESKTFTLRLQNTNRNGTLNMKEAVTVLNFSPQFSEDDTEEATKNIAETFSNVLAGVGPTGQLGSDGKYAGIYFKGSYIPADQILQTITNHMENVDTGGYMGNVGNASDDQKALISAIFGENVVMQIGNYYYSVQLLIKNQKINGDNQNDMVLYVTADQLDVGGGRWQDGNWGSSGSWVDLNRVPVYGLVFIYNNQTKKYDYVDHLFAGTAPVCNFGGTLASNATGNFNTNLWESTEYNVTDNCGGDITESYITTNGELDEAYAAYAKS